MYLAPHPKRSPKEMAPRLMIFCVLTTSVSWSQQLPDFSDPDIPPPVVGNLEERPKLAIKVSDEGEISIDGVTFDDDQLAVVFRLVFAREPKTVILIQANPVGINYSRKILRIASKEGINDAVFSPHKKTKTA